MDYRLLYSQRALNDLAEIIGYIAKDDPDAAFRFGSSLLDHVELLTKFPRMGVIARKRTGVRKLLHTPIFVYYEVQDDKEQVEILHFRHAARKPPRSEIRTRR